LRILPDSVDGTLPAALLTDPLTVLVGKRQDLRPGQGREDVVVRALLALWRRAEAFERLFHQLFRDVHAFGIQLVEADDDRVIRVGRRRDLGEERRHDQPGQQIAAQVLATVRDSLRLRLAVRSSARGRGGIRLWSLTGFRLRRLSLSAGWSALGHVRVLAR